MLCPKCNLETDDGSMVCKNCGEQLSNEVINVVNTENNVTEDSKPKFKLSKKLIIIISIVLFVIVAAIVLIIVLTKKGDNSSFKDPFESFSTDGYKEIGSSGSSILSNTKFASSDVVIPESMAETLKSDYTTGKITIDDYVKQTLYAIYEPNKLKSSYKSLSADAKMLDDIITFAAENINKLSDDTILYIANNYYMIDTEDIETKLTSNTINDYNVSQLTNEGKLNKFDSAVLSPNGNFIIYYSKKGSNATTKSYAENVGKILEETVDAYKNKYGFTYKYQLADIYRPYIDTLISNFQAISDAANLTKWMAVLTASKIPIEKIRTAMPVYVIDFTGSIQGKYNDSANTDTRILANFAYIWCKAFPKAEGCDALLNLGGDGDNDTEMILNMFNTMYLAPNFVVDSNSNDEDIRVGAMHELFHHYQHTHICNDTKCPSSFVAEAAANLAVVQNYSPKQLNETLINTHAVAYSRDSDKPIDQQRSGYPAYAFLYNYAQLVSNGTSIALNSQKSSTPLKELYDKSGGKYKDAMVKTAGGNLTLDYSNYLLIPYLKKEGINIPKNYKSYSYTGNTLDRPFINYSSAHYYYIKPYTNIDPKTQVLVSLSDELNPSEMTVVLYGRNDSQKSFKEIYRQDLDKQFVLTIRDFTNIYGELAIMVVNSSYTNNRHYTYYVITNSEYPTSYEVPNKNIEKNSAKDKDDLGFSEADLEKARSIYCERTETDSDEMNQKSEVLINYKDKKRISDLYVKETLDISGVSKDSQAYNLAKTLLDVSFQAIEQLFNMYFKDAKTIYNKSSDKYSLTIKIPKAYFDNLGDVYEFEGNKKIDIVRGLTKEGFKCYLKY